jgi:hypothetical protein
LLPQIHSYDKNLILNVVQGYKVFWMPSKGLFNVYLSTLRNHGLFFDPIPPLVGQFDVEAALFRHVAG